MVRHSVGQGGAFFCHKKVARLARSKLLPWPTLIIWLSNTNSYQGHWSGAWSVGPSGTSHVGPSATHLHLHPCYTLEKSHWMCVFHLNYFSQKGQNSIKFVFLATGSLFEYHIWSQTQIQFTWLRMSYTGLIHLLGSLHSQVLPFSIHHRKP